MALRWPGWAAQLPPTQSPSRAADTHSQHSSVKITSTGHSDADAEEDAAIAAAVIVLPLQNLSDTKYVIHGLGTSDWRLSSI